MSLAFSACFSHAAVTLSLLWPAVPAWASEELCGLFRSQSLPSKAAFLCVKLGKSFPLSASISSSVKWGDDTCLTVSWELKESTVGRASAHSAWHRPHGITEWRQHAVCPCYAQGIIR